MRYPDMVRRAAPIAGDGFLAAFDGPARTIRCACAVREALRPLGLTLRIGLNSGECEVPGDDLGGIAVHIGRPDTLRCSS